jgi:hypothetical protein
MQWESEEFIKKLWELRSRKEKLNPYIYVNYYDEVTFIDKNNIEKGISFYLPLNFVLLPTYMHIEIPESCKDIVQPKRSEVVDINEFSLFDVYKVVEEPTEGRFGVVTFGFSIKYREDINSYGIKVLRVIAEDKRPSRTLQDLSIISVFHDIFREEDTLARYLEKIKKLQGEKYSEIESIYSNISWLEEVLITTVNLINALHTNEFDENDIKGWLLKSYSDTFKGFGCELEEVLSSSARVISAFLF